MKYAIILYCDVDLGDEKINGYEFVMRVRQNGSQALICIHSNRSSPDDYKRSVDVGADAFLPKPMAAIHLLGLVVQCLRKLSETDTLGKPLTVALVEDEPFSRIVWEEAYKDHHFHTFETPDDFLKHMIASNSTFSWLRTDGSRFRNQPAEAV